MKQFVSLTMAFFAFCSANSLAQSSTITTYAGPSLPLSGSQAITHSVGVPQGVSADGFGGFYVSSSTHNRVYRIGSDGLLTVIAGNGSPGFSGDGGQATSAQLNSVYGITVDGAGNLYVADTSNNRIRKVTPGGAIMTIAGKGAWGFGGDGGPAVSAQLAGPRGIAVDQSGNLFIADSGNNRIRRVTPTGIISTVAGTGRAGVSGDGGPAALAELNYPVAVAVHADSTLFIADRNNHRVRTVTASGVITTLAGGTPGFSGDGGPAASAQISDPRGVAVDVAGNVFVADAGNNRIRVINTAGVMNTVVGISTAGFSGDGGLATLAQLALPVHLALDERGNLLIADRGNYRVRQVNTDGVINTVAGIGDDSGPAMQAQLNFPNAVAVHGAGNLFIADTDSQRIRKISPAGMIITVAGNGAAGFRGDGGAATAAQLNYPAAIAVDASGNLLIADTRNQRIRKVTPDGIITTIAGNGSAGFGGDGGSALLAQLNEPRGVALDRQGNLFIADTNNHRLRKVSTDGVISTIAGTGSRGFAGDIGPATEAQLAYPTGIAIDAANNAFIADSYNNRVRVVTPDGMIRTVAGNGTYGFGGDARPALLAQLANPNSVTVDQSGNLFIADTENQRIRQVSPDGIIYTVAGNGTNGVTGDGGPASLAQLALPFGAAVDGMNTLFIADTFSSRIRRVVFTSAPFNVVNGGGTSLETTGYSTSIQTGYGRIQPALGTMSPAGLAIFSYRAGGYLISETGVPATPPLSSGRVYAEVNGPVNTGLAIANPNNQAATIRFFFTDVAGNDLGSATTRIGAGQQIARFLDAEPFKTFPGSTFQGTFSFTSDVPVGVVALRGLFNARQDFLMSTLPVIDTSVLSATGTMVVPHFADGGGWMTQILLMNPTNRTLSGNIEWRDANGALTAVTVSEQTSSTATYLIPARASQKLVTTGTASTVTVGSVRILPNDGGTTPIPLVIFSYRPGRSITVSEAGVPSASGTAFRVYAESSGSIQSGIAIANNTSSPATVTFEITNLDGSTGGMPTPVSRSVAGFGHVSQFVTELFPDLRNAFKGILRVSTASEISVIGLRSRYNERNDFLITTTPPISETAARHSGELLLPHLADGAGYTTQFIIFSGSGNETSSGSLLLFQNLGQPLGVTLK